MADALVKREHRVPWVARVLFMMALLSLAPAVMCFAGAGGQIHPALADPMAGVAFLVSSIALAGSGAFPLVLSRLADKDPGQ
jgi:hypothetical protein